MHVSFNALREFDVAATNGAIGHPADLFFDDTDWEPRFLVIDTGGWIHRHLVTVPAEACGRIDVAHRRLPVDLTRKAVEDSPDIEAQKPFNRRHETMLSDYFRMASHRADPQHLDPHFPRPNDLPAADAPNDDAGYTGDDLVHPDDVHLRSAREVEGYRVRARDGEIGHIVDFLVDDENLALRDVVVHTGGWLSDRDVIVAPSHALGIAWELRTVSLDLTRDEAGKSPRYDTHQPLDPDQQHRFAEFWRRYMPTIT
jgi:hypothetical protein